MELVMDIIRVVLYLVWIIVGIMSIGIGAYYYKIMKPVLKPMVKMYANMVKEYEDELE